MLKIRNFRLLIKNEQFIAKIVYNRINFSQTFIRYWLKFNKNFFITDDYLSVASAT